MNTNQIINYLNIKCKLKDDQIEKLTEFSKQIKECDTELNFHIMNYVDSVDLLNLQFTWGNISDWNTIADITDIIYILMDFTLPTDKKLPTPIYELSDSNNVGFETNITINMQILDRMDHDVHSNKYKFIENFIKNNCINNDKINKEIIMMTNENGVNLFIKNANIFTMINIRQQILYLRKSDELIKYRLKVTISDNSFNLNKHILN